MNSSLFGGASVYQVTQQQRDRMRVEIEGYDGDRLLNTSPNDLAEYFAQKYNLDPPHIVEDRISVDQRETSHQTRSMFDEAMTVKSTEYLCYIPFEGEKQLFQVSPSSSRVYSEHVEIAGGELVVRFRPINPGTDHLQQEIRGFIQSLSQDLARLASDLVSFNSGLKAEALQRIEQRRAKLLSDRNTVASLGFPLRQRAGAAQTYIVPVERRRVEVRPPAASSAPFMPDPTLDMKEYENILDIMFNMALVLERSPATFGDMGEEDLRQHFLVQLNGQYEGQATGETFNAAGKTDILIRQNGGNLFVGECKFWGGEKKLFETVDQLLSYITWRDTKTCVVLFNRNKNFSAVLETITAQMPNHPNYKRSEPYKRETGFRYILHHPSDKNKELVTTILAFDILAPGR